MRLALSKGWLSSGGAGLRKGDYSPIPEIFYASKRRAPFSDAELDSRLAVLGLDRDASVGHPPPSKNRTVVCRHGRKRVLVPGRVNVDEIAAETDVILLSQVGWLVGVGWRGVCLFVWAEGVGRV